MAGSLDILFRIIARARAAGPFYFAAPTAPPPSATMLYFILLYFYSVLPVCVFFLPRYFSAAARSLLRRRGTSTRIRPNFAAPMAQIYHHNYARNSRANDLPGVKNKCANKALLYDTTMTER